MSIQRIALVTGASKGIGAAIAVRLAQDGFDLWLNYRSDHDGAERVRQAVEACGAACLTICFDVADSAATQRALEPLLESGTPYVLVNNAGFTRDGIFALMSQKDWDDVLAVSLGGFFNVTRLVLKDMVRKRRGRIVNIVSTSGQSGLPSQVNYSAAKAGLIGATKALAAEVGRRNILVNSVSPGFIETEMTLNLPREKLLPLIPLQRFGTPEEVAHAVSFLCSDQSSYITGQVISVNGGVYM
jgi:3-oxoacyl-[acyl-carrier protein] reductase